MNNFKSTPQPFHGSSEETQQAEDSKLEQEDSVPKASFTGMQNYYNESDLISNLQNYQKRTSTLVAWNSH